MIDFLNLMKEIFVFEIKESEVYDFFINENIKVYHIVIKELDTNQIIRKQISKEQYELFTKLLTQK